MSKRAAVLFVFVCALALSLFGGTLACSGDSGPTGDPPDDKRTTAAQGQALTASCTGPTCQLTVTIPKGLEPVAAANSSLRIHGFAQVKELDGRFAPLTNTGAGPGTHETEIGASAEVGRVVSIPPVTVRSRAVITGDVISEGAITLEDSSVRVTGASRANADLDLTTRSWSVSWPSTTGSAINLDPGVTRAVGPGAYGACSLKSRSTLQLSAGNYFFDELLVEPDATLQITTADPVVIHVRNAFNWAGIIRRTAEVPNVLVVALGARDYPLTRPFHGSLFAPRGRIQLFTVSAPGHKGTFYADSVMIEPGFAVQKWPFTRNDCATADPTRCGEVLGCPASDRDGDSLSDCDETADGDGWTDPDVFNGARVSAAPACHSAPTCASIDSIAEVNTCTQSTPWSSLNQYAGWDWRVAASDSNLCSGRHGFLPQWTTCGDNWQIDAKSTIKLSKSGQHCFEISGQTSSECGALFVGTQPSIVTGNVRCYSLAADVYPLRWFWEGRSGSENEFHLKYCYGGASACTPGDAIPNRMLRAQYAPDDRICDADECTDLCPCGPGSACTNDAQCDAGLQCRPRGEWFGAPGTSVCVNEPGCLLNPKAIGCGYPGAPCGLTCSDAPPCQSDSDCPAGKTCGRGNGRRFASDAPNHCWDPCCEGECSTQCGTARDRCGECVCEPQCNGKTCGGDMSDGCGGQCPAVCTPDTPGCTEDIHCPAGYACFEGQGARKGLPAGSNVCMPVGCPLPPPACGSVDAPCGECPTCTPDCSRRECGVDPVCGTSCGECAAGEFCGSTECVSTSSTPPIVVPTPGGVPRPVDPLVPPPNSMSSLGATAGQFTVSDRGTANYTIPIQVPPGKGNFVPELALHYEGTQANGILGIGWSLSGLSQVTRCQEVFALDGKTAPIDDSSGDAGPFCLDGKRLLHNEAWFYHTLVDTQRRVEFNRTEGASRYWVVTDRDGSSLTYGDNEASIARSPVSGLEHVWRLSRAHDGHGNGIQYEYTPSSGANHPLLSAVRYSYAPAVYQPRREVRFNYEPRPDIQRGRGQTGIEYQLLERLASIQTFVEGKPVRTYRLTYETARSGASRLAQVQECAADTNTCLNPTVFAYNEELAFVPGATDPLPNGSWLDANGDGIQDLLEVTGNVTGGTLTTAQHIADWSVTLGTMAMDTATGFTATIAWITAKQLLGWGESDLEIKERLYRSRADATNPFDVFNVTGLRCMGTSPSLLLDYDGDGRDDVLQLCPKYVMIDGGRRQKQTGYEIHWARWAEASHNFSQRGKILDLYRSTEQNPRCSGVQAKADMCRNQHFITRPHALDLDGDGLNDIVSCFSAATMQWHPRKRGAREEGFEAPVQFPSYGEYCRDGSLKPLLLDHDGDGTANLLVPGAEGRWAALHLTAAGPAWKQDVLLPAGVVGFGDILVGDYNGDQLTDLLLPQAKAPWRDGEKTPILWLNQGGRFEPQGLVADVPLGQSDQTRYLSFDLDRDFRADVLEYWGNPFFYSNLRKLDLEDSTISTESLPQLLFDWDYATDLDGDGNLDLVRKDNVDVVHGKGVGSSLLREVVDGLGNYVSVSYSQRENGTDTYTPGYTCAWPQQCIRRLPNLVASHVSGFKHGNVYTARQRYVHRYEDARIDKAGHGWLGFGRRELEVQVAENGGFVRRSVTQTRYKLPQPNGVDSDQPSNYSSAWFYPLAGLPEVVRTQVEPTSSSIAKGPRSRVITTNYLWAPKRSYLGVMPVLVSKTTDVGEVDPATPEAVQAISSEQEHLQVDVFGNVTRREVSGPTTTVTTATYEPSAEDLSAWRVSHPKLVSIKSTRGSLNAEQRYSYAYEAGLPVVVRRDTGDSALKRQTLLTWDEGNLTHVEVTTGDPESARHTSFVYDAEGVFPLVVRNSKGHATQLRYDSRFGQPTVITDPNGIAERYAYDDFGRLVSADGPDGASEVRIETPQPEQAGQTDWLTVMQVRAEHQSGAVSVTGIDPAGQVTYRRQRGYAGQLVSESFEYDALGQLVRATRPHLAGDTTQGAIRNEYDALGRLTRTTNADQTFRVIEYATKASLKPEHAPWLSTPEDGGTLAHATEIVRSADELNKADVQIFDRHGNVLRNVDGSGARTKHIYGPFNRLWRLVDNANNFTDFFYDHYARLFAVDDPNSGLYIAELNGFDEITKLTRPDGTTTQNRYDTLGRLIQSTSNDGISTWTYDGAGPNELGRLVQTQSPGTAQWAGGQIVRYNYEPPTSTTNRGLLRSVSYLLDGQPALTSTFSYDAASRLERVQYPSSSPAASPFIVRYNYDGPHVDGVYDASTGTEAAIWRITATEQALRVRQEAFGPTAPSSTTSLTTNYEYDPLTGRTGSIVTRRGTTAVQSLGYGYKKNGAVDFNRHDGVTDTYSYDALDRLTDVNRSGGAPAVDSYRYSALGNFTSSTRAGNYNYSGNAPHLPTNIGSHNFTHDIRGNQRTRTGPLVPGGTQTIDYTAFDLPARITAGTGAAALTTRFEYSADQQRVVKRDPTATTYYAGDLYRRIVPTNPTTPAQERFAVFVEGRQIAEVARSSAGTRTYYLHADLLGSITAISDATSNQTYKQEFTVFGQPITTAVAQTGVTAGYTGHEHDHALGLINMRGRVYDPTFGRFLTADPVIQAPFWSQGQNRYSYVFNNPTNLIDPSGFSSTDINAAAGGLWATPYLAAYAGAIGGGIGGGIAAGGINAGVGMLGGGPGAPNLHAPSTAPHMTPGGKGKYDATAQGAAPRAGGVDPNPVSLAYEPGTFCASHPRVCSAAGEVVSDVGRVARVSAGALVVLGDLLWPSTTQTPEDEIRTGGVNLDTSALTALAQANDGALSLRVKLLIGARIPVASATAINEFRRGLAATGPIERANGKVILKWVRRVPDMPSHRASRLIPTRRLGLNDIIILGTGDSFGIQTITADRRAVSAANAQGVYFDVVLIPPVRFGGI